MYGKGIPWPGHNQYLHSSYYCDCYYLPLMTSEMEGSNKEQDVGWYRQPVRLEIIGKLVTAILH